VVEFDVSPKRTALLNIDVQNYFVQVAHEGDRVIERVNQLAQVCREAGILVIHTRHAFRPDGSNVGLLGEFVPLSGTARSTRIQSPRRCTPTLSSIRATLWLRSHGSERFTERTSK
jgi:nicotinamidase-related amidase